MSIVNTPLKYSGATNGATRRAMAIGQYVIAVVLTVVGMLRGLADAAAPVIAVVAIGILFLAWHTAGSWIPKRTDSLRLLRWWLIGLAALWVRSEEHTSELQSRFELVCRLLLEKKNYIQAVNRILFVS